MTYTARRIAGLLDEELPWLSVRAADAIPGPEWISCGALVEEQQAGGDPTADWRAALAREYGEQYGVEPPVQVAAMFVLMWYVGVPALVAGLSGALTGVSPDVSPSSLAFRRHPTQHFPTEIALLSDRVVPLEVAAAQLTEHTSAFLESFRPEVKLSSLQRYGAAEDELRRAIQTPEDAEFAKEAASAFGIDLDQQVRTSCCFFYVLPGVTPCGGCPRIR